MSLYPKRLLQVQFITFGVEHHGVTIPILRQGKDRVIPLPTLSSSVGAPIQTGPSSR